MSMAPGFLPSSSKSAAKRRPPRPGQPMLDQASDDIPMARRLEPLRRRGTPWPKLVVALAVVMAVGSTAVLVWQPTVLLRFLAPVPLAGLASRPGLDGRLLGHFPYPEAAALDLVTVAPGLRLHRDAADALLQLLDAARADGIEIKVLSGFRSVALQQQLFFDVKSSRNQSAQERARVSAPPGYSEHSTGFAVDLGDARNPQTDLSGSFAQTSAFAWLTANAARFHFILSFPPGNQQAVSYEPWHWRFEGSAAALQQFEPAQRLAGQGRPRGLR